MLISHRGNNLGVNLDSKYYENTFEAISDCLKLDVDGVEIDVFSSADNICYIIHNREIEKHSKFYYGDITKLKSNEIDEIYVGNKRQYKIPRLLDVMRYIKKNHPDKILNIEIKQKNIVKSIYKEIYKSKINKDNIIISSFYHQEVIDFRKLDNEIKLGFLCEVKHQNQPDFTQRAQKLLQETQNSIAILEIDENYKNHIEFFKSPIFWTVNLGDYNNLKIEKSVNIITDQPKFILNQQRR